MTNEYGPRRGVCRRRHRRACGLAVLGAIPAIAYAVFAPAGEWLSSWLYDRGVRDSAWRQAVGAVAACGGLWWFIEGGPPLAGVVGFAGIGFLLWRWNYR